MKKGQMEAMGLVIIVFLVIIIGLFSIRFMGGDSDDNDIYYSIKVNNLVNAIYKSDVSGQSFSSLARGCCDGNNFDCERVISFVNGTINSFVDEKALFELNGIGGAACITPVGDCDEGVGSNSVFMPGGYEIRANLCRR